VTPGGEDADVETSSHAYARRFAGSVGRWFLEVQERTTLELLGPWPGASVVDVGGGHGQVAAPLAAAGYAVTVVGSRPVCVERVQDLVSAGRVRFQAADLMRLPFADRSFDVAVSFRLLPHVARWSELVAELGRVARRGVVVDYPTRRSLNAVADPLFSLKKGVEGNTRPFRVFRDAEIEAAFAKSGFFVTARRPQFFWPMALHRAFGLLPLSRGLEAATALAGLRRVLGSPVLLRLERRS
jgi:2-polyprenyl-3-methyl-5-hydroxy-6-metoxy-1,4-benzoquinol methylase